MIPQRLGPYQIARELGSGASGTVYAARRADGTPVAVKVLSKQTGISAARFERERRLLVELASEGGFVPILDAGDRDGTAYLVMPLLLGGTLRDRLARGPLPPEDALALVKELASSLGRAHARGIVHRDLKPENVLFDATGRAFVADLGLAKRFESTQDDSKLSRSLSKSGALLGTIGYAPPEQLTDAKAVGPPADVHALGAILYECLTGKTPYEAESQVATIARQAQSRFAPLSDFLSDVPRPLEALVARALAPRPQDRFLDGGDLAAALEEVERDAAGPAGTARKVALASLAAILVLGTGALAGWLVRRAIAPSPGPPSPSPRATPDSPGSASPTSASPTPRPSASGSRRDDAIRLVLSGEAARRAHDTKAAREAFDEATRADPTYARAWSEKAELALDEGRIDEGATDCERALSLDHDDVLGLLARAAVAFRRGNPDAALADATRATTMDPRNAKAWKFLAGLHQKRRELDKSLACLERALEVDADADAYVNRAALRYARGQLGPAREDLDRALELDPRCTTGWSNRASVRLEQGDLPGAIADADRALALDPRDDMAWTHRGIAHMVREESGLAEADFRRALEVNPANRPSLSNLALVLAQRGERDESRRLADQAVAQDPDNPDTLALRGRVRMLAGERDGAIRDLERALARGLAGPKANLARRSLQELRGN